MVTFSGINLPAGYSREGSKLFLDIEVKQGDSHSKKTTDLKSISKYLRVSISGHTIRPRGRSMNSAGQIINDLKSGYSDSKRPLSDTDRKRLVSIWERWHLNDVKAGTRKQENALKNIRKYSYNGAVTLLKRKGLYVDRGYEYGSGWLVEPVPSNVVSDLKRITEKLRKLR